ncbi:uncharacterized protein LOC108660293 [Drosophila navojoa]|uniref:uncharacterized protein LOC108660293 n=1 Tax=Drosophila navojoa TaxID=7232 RepID=UPI000846D20A|nr:uncharacterized protein LOC108660293 [Drosophila navojoa]
MANSPSIFFVLFWRIGVHLLYPYRYTNRSIQDALGDDYLVWVSSDRSQNEQVVYTLLRQSLENFLIFILIMEVMHFIQVGRNMRLVV